MTTRSRRTRLLLLAAILAVAAGLRLWRLDRAPSGVWVDEAIEGVQARALRTGETLPGTKAIPFPRWPVWCGLETLATGLGGDTAGAIRLPAAVAGIAAVWLTWGAGRALMGPVAGLGAAAFLAGSFWHLQYSRLALPCVMAVGEGLVMAWLLLRPGLPGAAGGLALAGLCVISMYGYAASLVTPVAAGLILIIRAGGTRPDRFTPGFRKALAVGALVLLGLISWRRPESLTRSAELSAAHGDTLPGEVLGWARSMIWKTDPGPGFWRHYPPGAPRLTPIELALALAGIGWLFVTRTTNPRRWTGWAVWAGVSVLPEWYAGGAPHLIRGLPQLGPLAIAAGAGAAWLIGRGRWGAPAVIALLTVNTAWTAITLERFARDPVVAGWSLQADRDAADWIVRAASRSPVILAPAFNYERTPVMLFDLGPAVRDGRIDLRARDPGRTRVAAIFREREHGEPVSVLFEGVAKTEGRRHFWLRYVHELPVRDRETYRRDGGSSSR